MTTSKSTTKTPPRTTTTTHLTTVMPLRSRTSVSIGPASKNPRPKTTKTIDMAPAHAEDDDEEQDDESDDEAPETISLSTSKAQSRASEATATRAIKDAEERARSKRRSKQEKLQEQARERERRKQIKEAETKASVESADEAEDFDSEDDSEEEQDEKDSDDVAMAGFLPAELLAGLSDMRPPTPPPEIENESKPVDPAKKFARKGVVVLPSLGTRQDLKLDSYTVRVLEKRNERLPPRKIMTKTTCARDRWLQGRNVIAAATGNVKKKGFKIKSGRVERRPFGAQKGFF